MLIDDARQVEAAARRILAQVNDGSASCEEMHTAMPALKSASAMITAAQTSAAASIAGSERHGDGGAEVLAAAAGLPLGEARNHIKTAETLRDLPAVRDAVESGRVSQANAKRLAAAVETAGAQAVESDGELLAKAQSMRPEQFTREARRWVADHEGDNGEGEHARQRARRCVRIWHNDDDGMMHLHGQFDTVTGRRIENRLRAEARRLHDTDKKHAAGGQVGRRSFDQCMADALDHLTNTTTSSAGTSGGGKPFADICVVAHVDDATGELIAELPDGERLPKAVLEQLGCNGQGGQGVSCLVPAFEVGALALRNPAVPGIHVFVQPDTRTAPATVTTPRGLQPASAGCRPKGRGTQIRGRQGLERHEAGRTGHRRQHEPVEVVEHRPSEHLAEQAGRARVGLAQRLEPSTKAVRGKKLSARSC